MRAVDSPTTGSDGRSCYVSEPNGLGVVFFTRSNQVRRHLSTEQPTVLSPRPAVGPSRGPVFGNLS
jgi:hypothetical protein